MLQRIKAFWEAYREELTLGLTILIVAFLSFSLGRLSATHIDPVSLGTRAAQQANAETAIAPSSNAAFVASKTGSKYYPISCVSAHKIQEADRVYFAAEADAEASGYQPSASCR